MHCLVYFVLLVVVGLGHARYLDEQTLDLEATDANTLDVQQEEQTVALPTEEKIPEEEEPEDSCEDFPPASCIRHFSPLPGSLQRSPFALRTETDFINICDAYKKALQCFNGFHARCHAENNDARKFIEQMSALLDQCDNQQIRQDVIASLECGRRMSAVHERCIRETRFVPQLKDLSSERMLRGDENSIRDLCCGMKYHKICYMDQVLERCGQPALEANLRLESVIMRGFTCEAFSSSDCPTIRQ
ncbi:hypothetical protein BV898_03519 [Hypsibius exemplaris]|uniref:DUF19 domain-containing protein n=1 Tax=Hypsibius exemplaris TaxID=2072580 RepID=A0A1W0X5R7_HYPEX|nr:hypothetical protein BV898_03519 [Hypsibius exemplaris]